MSDVDPLRPVERRSAEARALEALRDAIVSGGLAQGSRITEIDLSNRLDVSRATVRSALHTLAAEGLVIQTPYAGWAVLSLGPDDVWELLTLRASLEGLAGRLAAQRHADSERPKLEAAMDDLRAACTSGTADEVADADFRLHETIVALAGHGRLSEHYRRLRTQVRLHINAGDALVFDKSEIIGQHEPIVRAVLARDAALAGSLSEQHNLTEGQLLLDRVEADFAMSGAQARTSGANR